jgi:hypothetical protein
MAAMDPIHVVSAMSELCRLFPNERTFLPLMGASGLGQEQTKTDDAALLCFQRVAVLGGCRRESGRSRMSYSGTYSIHVSVTITSVAVYQ